MAGLALEHLELEVGGSWDEDLPAHPVHFFPAIQLAALTSLALKGGDRVQT